MIPRRTVEARSDLSSPRTSVVSSSLAFFVSTDDPSLTMTSAPAPVLALSFRLDSAMPFNLVPPPTAPQLAGSWRTSPFATREAPRTEPDRPDTREGSPPPAPPAVSVDSSRPETPPPEAEPEAKKGSSQIELIIDSLPNHSLSEPIPVAIVSLGDKVFTASVTNMNIHGTGTSIGEALLVLKEQIEEIYAELSKRPSHLDTDQKATLQLLQTYIAPSAAGNSKRPEWL